MKKVLAYLLTLVMITAVFTACGSPKAEPSTTEPAETAEASDDSTKAPATENGADSDTSLRIGWWGSQARHDGTLAVMDLYTEQTGVQFEAEFLPFDGYFTKLNALVASGDVYDIFQLGGNFPNYLEQLEPLDDYIANGIIDTTYTSDSYLETTQYNGKQYGLSLGTNTYGIAYDPALFAEAGVAEPTNDWTWEEFEEAAMTIHETLGIFGSSYLHEFFAGGTTYVTQFSEDYTFFKPEGGGLNYDDDSIIASYFSLIKRLTDAGAYPDPGMIAEIKDIEGDYLVTGDAAMTWVASNQFIAVSNAAERELKIVLPPRQEKGGITGSAMQSSQLFGVYSGSDHKEEAAKFINFFVGDVDANMILQGERGISIMSNVRDALLPTLPEAEQEVYAFVDYAGANASHQIVLDPPEQPEIMDLYKRLLDQVVFDELTPDEAAAQLRTEAEAIFAKSA